MSEASAALPGWSLTRAGQGLRSAHDVVVHGIGRRILGGEFGVGSILPGDQEMMEQFGVSRTSLREALKTLAAKGLIEPKTRVGTRVLDAKNWNMFDADVMAWHLERGIDGAFLGRLFEIRLALEPLAAAAAAAASRAREAVDIARMTRAWEAMRTTGHSRDSFTAADLAFHRAILDASGNPFLQSIGSVIEAALATSFTVSSPVEDPERFALSGRQHRLILDAIIAGDAQRAGDAMADVIRQGMASAGIDALAAPEVRVRLNLLGGPPLASPG